MATTIKANVSFDIPAIISDPVLGFAATIDPENLAEEIAKLNITDAIFTFQKHGGTSFTKPIRIPNPPSNGKISTTADLDVDSTYYVHVRLQFSDKDDERSATVTVVTSDEIEYGEIAKKIFAAEDEGGRAAPIAGAVITITNPDGDDWTATSRAEDGLIYLQRIPVGSYAVASIVKEDYDTLNPSQLIVVTADGINWNESLPIYTLIATPTPTA